MATTPTRTSGDDRSLHDSYIEESERAAAEGGARNLFDLRFIIGGMFLLYGAYLTIRGILDSAAAVEQAAGVRINLWTGLGALAVGGIFVAWALLRPLTVEQIVEGTAEDVEQELGDRAAGERVKARRPSH
jgi:hypothetical protein